MRIGLFTPDRAFDMVSKAQIAKLKEPSLKLVDLVTSEMLTMCKDAAVKVNLSLPSLHHPWDYVLVSILSIYLSRRKRPEMFVPRITPLFLEVSLTLNIL